MCLQLGQSALFERVLPPELGLLDMLSCTRVLVSQHAAHLAPQQVFNVQSVNHTPAFILGNVKRASAFVENFSLHILQGIAGQLLEEYIVFSLAQFVTQHALHTCVCCLCQHVIGGCSPCTVIECCSSPSLDVHQWMLFKPWLLS